MSSALETFRKLSPRTRLGIGIGFIAWGGIGLYVSDRAEKRLGFEPTQKDKDALQATMPRITIVDRKEREG